MTNELNETKEFLTFTLGGETITLEAAQVREVLKYTPIIQVPRMPSYMPGVINVRGNVIAVIDLALVLGVKPLLDPEKGWLVITEVHLQDETMLAGILADTVQDVIRLDMTVIGPPPDIGINIDADFIQGVFKLDDEFVVIIDIEKVIASVHADLCRE